MIRVNNLPVAEQYLQALQVPTQRLVVAQIVSVVSVLGVVAEFGDYMDLPALFWVILEFYLFARVMLKKKSLSFDPDLLEQYEAVVWRKKMWKEMLFWRFLKVISWLLSLFTLFESQTHKESSWHFLSFVLLLLFLLFLSIYILKLTNSILQILSKLNRVFTNFVIDFGNDQQDEQTIKELPQNIRILKGMHED